VTPAQRALLLELRNGPLTLRRASLVPGRALRVAGLAVAHDGTTHELTEDGRAVAEELAAKVVAKDERREATRRRLRAQLTPRDLRAFARSLPKWIKAIELEPGVFAPRLALSRLAGVTLDGFAYCEGDSLWIIWDGVRGHSGRLRLRSNASLRETVSL